MAPAALERISGVAEWSGVRWDWVGWGSVGFRGEMGGEDWDRVVWDGEVEWGGIGIGWGGVRWDWWGGVRWVGV